jgi:hypothetical protein
MRCHANARLSRIAVGCRSIESRWMDGSVRRAAESAGISGRTVRRWPIRTPSLLKPQTLVRTWLRRTGDRPGRPAVGQAPSTRSVARTRDASVTGVVMAHAAATVRHRFRRSILSGATASPRLYEGG